MYFKKSSKLCFLMGTVETQDVRPTLSEIIEDYMKIRSLRGYILSISETKTKQTEKQNQKNPKRTKKQKKKIKKKSQNQKTHRKKRCSGITALEITRHSGYKILRPISFHSESYNNPPGIKRVIQ